METLDEAEYLATQAQIRTFAGILKGIPLGAFLNTLNRAETITPFLEAPAGRREGSG